MEVKQTNKQKKQFIIHLHLEPNSILPMEKIVLCHGFLK